MWKSVLKYIIRLNAFKSFATCLLIEIQLTFMLLINIPDFFFRIFGRNLIHFIENILKHWKYVDSWFSWYVLWFYSFWSFLQNSCKICEQNIIAESSCLLCILLVIFVCVCLQKIFFHCYTFVNFLWYFSEQFLEFSWRKSVGWVLSLVLEEKFNVSCLWD